MSMINFGYPGRVGIIKDAAPQELPDFAWTDGQNIRFNNDSVLQADGYTTVLDSPSTTPSFIVAVPQQSNTSDLLVWFTQNNTAHVWDNVSATAAEITNASITGSSSVYAWAATLLSGILVATNGSDPPQRWVFPPDTSTLLTDLDNWTATHTCRVLRAFRQHLIALDTTEDGDRYPYRVKWGDPAEPGAVPGSWDEADVNGDAGTFDLIEGGDIILDGLPLKDQFFIYKENSVWSMRYVGGTSIWAFSQVFNGWGLMARGAVCEASSYHYLVTRTDIIRHNGYDVESIADARVRNYLIDSIDPNNLKSVEAKHHRAKQEIWFTFNDGSSSTGNTQALVWNYRFETWSIIHLPEVTSLTVATLAAQPDTQTWDGEMLMDWDTGSTDRWVGSAIYPIDQMVFSSIADMKIYRSSQDDFSHNGTTPLCFVERIGFPLAGYRRDGQGPTVDTRIKYVKRLWPRIRYKADVSSGYLDFYIGYRFDMSESITWEGPYQFDPSSDRKIDCRVSGREISLRVWTRAVMGWILDSIDIEYDVDSDF